MAVRHTGADAAGTAIVEPWEFPVWPSEPPDPAATRVVFGREADELVVRFPCSAGRRSVVISIATGDREDVGVLSDQETGEVIGIQVDLLLRMVAARYPSWSRLAEPDPPVEVVAAFIDDVADLFARYGAGETPPRR